MRFCGCVLTFLAGALLFAGTLTSAAQSPTPAATSSPSPLPTPIPVASIVAEGDSAANEIALIQGGLADDAGVQDLQKFIPRITQDIDERDLATSRILEAPSKITTIQDQTANWAILREQVTLHSEFVKDKLARLDENAARLAGLVTLWNATGKEATAAKAPPDILNRIASVQQQLTAASKAVAARRVVLLGLQSKVADQNGRINKVLTALHQARGVAIDRLFVRESHPLWKAWSLDRQTPAPGELSLSAQFGAVGDYLIRERGVVALHVIVWLCLVALFHWARRKTKRWTENDPDLEGSTTIFEVPLATSTLIAICLGFIFYAGAPTLMIAILGAALLLPLMFVVSKLIEPPLQPITWALAAFYLASQVREATALFPLIPRLIYLAEGIAGIIFALWLLRLPRFSDSPRNKGLMRKIVRAAARIGLVVFVVAGTANVLGYVSFSLYVGTVALDSAYAALLLYASIHIVEGFLTFVLNTPPLGLLAMVRHHRAVLERRTIRVFRILGFVLWLVFTLDKMSLLGAVAFEVERLFSAPLIGGVTLGNITAFLLTVWASFLISKFVRFALEEDVYQRVRLKPGLPFAISTLLHYAILLLGFYLATAALLGDISKFTIIAGAFGVGIGFGLQNIVNNFVSSLIVLFERPVRLGDLIQIGDMQGTVRQIGIRATIIRTSAGSEIIIPNAKLISDPVTNWTLTTHQRLLQIDVATAAAGVDPQTVIKLLEETAAAQAEVSKNPAPQAVLAKFAAAALSFELRVWTADIQNMSRVKSRLTVAISDALGKAGIAAA